MRGGKVGAEVSGVRLSLSGMGSPRRPRSGTGHVQAWLWCPAGWAGSRYPATIQGAVWLGRAEAVWGQASRGCVFSGASASRTPCLLLTGTARI